MKNDKKKYDKRKKRKWQSKIKIWKNEKSITLYTLGILVPSPRTQYHFQQS